MKAPTTKSGVSLPEATARSTISGVSAEALLPSSSILPLIGKMQTICIKSREKNAEKGVDPGLTRLFPLPKLKQFGPDSTTSSTSKSSWQNSEKISAETIREMKKMVQMLDIETMTSPTSG